MAKDPNPLLAAAHLRLQHILLCQALAEAGTVREAATQLHRTQPALTKMLQELEASLGVQLFERGRLGSQPTAAGAAFIERTAVMLNEWSAALEELQSISQGEGGLLRVGATPLTTLALMPQALERLRQEHAGLLVRFREASIHELLLALEAGELDCVVGRYSGEMLGTEAIGRLRHERLYDEVLAVVAGPAHPLAGRRRVTWKDLAEVDWVLPPPNSPRARPSTPPSSATACCRRGRPMSPRRTPPASRSRASWGWWRWCRWRPRASRRTTGWSRCCASTWPPSRRRSPSCSARTRRAARASRPS